MAFRYLMSGVMDEQSVSVSSFSCLNCKRKKSDVVQHFDQSLCN